MACPVVGFPDVADLHVVGEVVADLAAAFAGVTDPPAEMRIVL
jgi:hypothetical protein